MPCQSPEDSVDLALLQQLSIDDDFEDLKGPETITEPITVLSETPIAISFSVHGESTIPNENRLFSMTVLSIRSP